MSSPLGPLTNDTTDAATRLKLAQAKLAVDTAAKASAAVLKVDQQAVTKAQAGVNRAGNATASYL
ncbi:MAG: hypothetical protein JWO68_552 [Actinomycetia bacterium]|jgi:hypothetical protein|nr:hypothetical protein [Actinomycetes bacterium]